MLVNMVRPKPIRPIFTETVRIFYNTYKVKVNEHFAMTYRQDCGAFASFLYFFSKQCTGTTPVTTVPKPSGLFGQMFILALQDA